MKHYLFLFLIFAFFGTQFANAETPAATQASNITNSKSSQTSGLTVDVGKYSEVISNDILNSWINQKSTYYISPFKNEFENSNYCPINKLICNLSITVSQKKHTRLTSVSVIDKQKIEDYVDSLSKKVNSKPEDAKFAVIDGKVTNFAEAADGITLDNDKSIEILISTLEGSDYLGKSISLPFDSQKAANNYGDVNSLGISSLLGEGVSDFKGSPVNRVKNIKAAITHFNGLLIKPGEEFSFVKNLGDVDAEHGYFPELVIKQNVTEPDYGGGICQVSTTAFRAAIYSGLKITARRNHAYPVSYYSPVGFDSTVYVPNPDLKFINNTPGYILIQVKIVGTQLIFDFYGTNDGRKTTVDGPKVTEKQPDGAIKTTFTQHVFDSNGKEFISDVFNSNYQSPYKFPHLGGPVLKAKPSNWSDDEWKGYQQTLKDLAKAAKNIKQ